MYEPRKSNSCILPELLLWIRIRSFALRRWRMRAMGLQIWKEPVQESDAYAGAGRGVTGTDEERKFCKNERQSSSWGWQSWFACVITGKLTYVTCGISYRCEDDMYDKLLIYRDLMSIMGIGKGTAYELIHSTCFPSIKINNRYYVRQSALEEWLADQEGKRFITKRIST